MPENRLRDWEGKAIGLLLIGAFGLLVVVALIQSAITKQNSNSNQVNFVDHSQPTPTVDPNYVPATPKPKTPGEIQKEAVAARTLYITNAERTFLDKGLDVYLSLGGKQKDELVMKYVLMSRPTVYKLSQDEGFVSTVRGLGFKKVIFTDGYSDRWTLDL